MIWRIYQLPDMLKIGTMVTVSTFRVSFSDIERPFLFSLHQCPAFLFSQILCLPPFTMCPSSWSLLYLAYAWCWRMKWVYSASRSWILFQWWYLMGWSNRCNVLCFLVRTVTFQLIFGPIYDIIHNLSGGCIVGARLHTIPTCHMLRARLEGWLS